MINVNKLVYENGAWSLYGTMFCNYIEFRRTGGTKEWFKVAYDYDVFYEPQEVDEFEADWLEEIFQRELKKL